MREFQNEDDAGYPILVLMFLRKGVKSNNIDTKVEIFTNKWKG